ncbi:MAG: HAD family phosphatase, partial [Rhodospirillales bacterium]|nr:HAD family phosphatase [Rhodospirillales bacterium]
RCLYEICAEFARPIREDEKPALFARSFAEMWEILGGENTFSVSYQEWCNAFAARYRSLAATGRARAGAIDTVRRLASMNVPQASVSNNVRALTEINLDIVDVSDFMAFLVCHEDVRRGKPDPEPYRKACERLNLKPDTCLAVDDSPVGVQSAKAAGLFTVAFPGTSSEASGFDFGAHADMVLRSMADFPWGRFEHFSTS